VCRHLFSLRSRAVCGVHLNSDNIASRAFSYTDFGSLWVDQLRIFSMTFSILALSFCLLACGGGSGSGSSEPSNNEFVYTINRNGTVSAFKADLRTGALRRLKESPFVTGGKDSIGGTIDLFDLFLFVTNQGSGDVSVFKVLANGGLKLVSGAPFFSGLGARSAVVTADERFLFVANTAANSISAFSLDSSSGVLTSLAGSPFSTGTGSAPTALALDTLSNFLYVTASGISKVLAFSIASGGGLTPIAGSPFPCGQNPNGIGITPRDAFLYTANFGDNSISAFSINASNGALNPITGSPFEVGAGPSSAAIDPAGLFLYVTNSVDDTVSGFNIEGAIGSLANVPGSPFATASQPGGAVVDGLGKFLWVANQGSDAVSGYRINRANGSLISLSGSPFNVEPASQPAGVVTASF
jgi:6-phosphogluconolactonase